MDSIQQYQIGSSLAFSNTTLNLNKWVLLFGNKKRFFALTNNYPNLTDQTKQSRTLFIVITPFL
jgi:hypothetical protein